MHDRHDSSHVSPLPSLLHVHRRACVIGYPRIKGSLSRYLSSFFTGWRCCLNFWPSVYAQSRRSSNRISSCAYPRGVPFAVQCSQLSIFLRQQREHGTCIHVTHAVCMQRIFLEYVECTGPSHHCLQRHRPDCSQLQGPSGGTFTHLRTWVLTQGGNQQ